MAFGVLVVDDNRSFANAARLLLERQGERVVGTASTSAEAVELVGDDHRDPAVSYGNDMMAVTKLGHRSVRYRSFPRSRTT